MVYVLFMTSPGPASTADLWQLLQRACPQERIQQLCREQGYTYRRGIYSILVVIWLMMYQRLNGKRSSSSAVHWLVRNAETCMDETHASGFEWTTFPATTEPIAKPGGKYRNW
jgi:hypothetical protein